MSAYTYQHILEEAEKLPMDQCLLLIERLVRHVRTTEGGQSAAPKWEDHAGTAPYPLCREDAQEWVSGERTEADERFA